MKNMRKWMMALMALICVSAMATEGVHFTRSGVRDMLIRMSGQERYLLIPIEEAAPEYRMQVIEDGRIVRTVVLRLAAKGKIDYYVPMDLSAFNREVTLCGYLPQMGLCHDNMYNPYNLSCDIIAFSPQ